MQGQKGYVNGYVVNIFKHYINRSGDGVIRGSVTWASFFGGVSQAEACTCGERACRVAASPALGGEAALKPAIAVCLTYCVGLIGAASLPNAGQARSPQGSIP